MILAIMQNARTVRVPHTAMIASVKAHVARTAVREAIPMSCRRALQLIKQKLSTAMPWYMRQAAPLAARETIDREQCAKPRLARPAKLDRPVG
ncbi:hypothetical protein M0804_002038 [Polistes exclamans]|nr:hypothetical protein M0804_002038 [Polistes exclamans]